jgi:hypothetical protein
MKKKSVFAASALLLTAAAGSALAGPPSAPARHQPAGAHPTAVLAPVTGRIEPISVQRVRYVNGHMMALGPVIPYVGGHSTRTNPQYAWDAYESGVDAASIPGQPPDGGRFLYEWTTGARDYRYGAFANQMVVPAAYNGAMATLVDGLFRSRVAEPFVMGIFTSEEYDTTCTDPAETNIYDGVALDFGTVTANGFFYFNADLSTAGLSLQLPMDGTGGFLITLNQDAAGTMHSTDAQLGFWGTGDHQTPVQARAGTEDITGYSDDSTPPTPAASRATNLPDGMIQATNQECGNWAGPGGATGPSQLCPGFGFGLKATTQTCQADINGDGVVNINDFLAYLALFAAADPRADINGDGNVNISDFLAYLALFAAGCP